MAGDTQQSPKHQRLAAELKQLRGAAGVSAEALGRRLGWSQSKVSKVENGRTKPTADDVRAWVSAVDADPDYRDDLVELADQVQTEAQAWRDLFRTSGGVEFRQRHYADLDARTVRMEIFEPALVPGILQTADYARQVFTIMQVDAEHDQAAIGRAAARRVDRQAVLYSGSLTVEAITTEAALRWLPGNPATLAAQLDRVLSLMTLDSVRVGVVPVGAGGPVPLTSFVLRHFADEPPIAVVELLTEEATYVAPDHVAAYQAMFAEFRKVAVYDDAAQALLHGIMRDVRAEPH